MGGKRTAPPLPQGAAGRSPKPGSGQHAGNSALTIEPERTRAITGEEPEPALVDTNERRRVPAHPEERGAEGRGPTGRNDRRTSPDTASRKVLVVAISP
jgi:hypothetical protein